MTKTEELRRAADLGAARNRIATLGDGLAAYIVELENRSHCNCKDDLVKVQAELARTRADLSIAEATLREVKQELLAARERLAAAEAGSSSSRRSRRD